MQFWHAVIVRFPATSVWSASIGLGRYYSTMMAGGMSKGDMRAAIARTFQASGFRVKRLARQGSAAHMRIGLLQRFLKRQCLTREMKSPNLCSNVHLNAYQLLSRSRNVWPACLALLTCAAVTDAVVSVDAMSRAIASFDSDATAEEAIKCETVLSGL